MNQRMTINRTKSFALGRTRTSVDPKDLELLSQIMDSLVRIPGVNWRVGIDPILGLVPGIGDLVSTFVSLYILLAAVQYGAPRITLLRMGLNIGIDLVVGSIPVVGDVFDVWWKANLRNVQLLRGRARNRSTRRAQLSDWLFVGLIASIVVALLVGSAALAVWLIGQIAAAFVR